MSTPSLPPIRTAGDRAAISIRDAAVTWVGAWLVGTLVASAIFTASGSDSVAEAGPGWLAAGAIAQWVPMVVAIWYLGRRDGVGNLSADFGLSFRPVDLIGLPIGLITQLVVVRLVYLPLESLWPDTFTIDKVEQRARDTYESASGGGLVLLVLVIVVGAPLVEELTYRGLLQGAFTRRLDDVIGVVAVALFFAIIHFQPVEIPGLFVVGLVLGVCTLRSGRLGMSVLAHVAFNATGLVLVATT
ncbi:MAG: CPBP family intramembrane metalloprotease [Actinomycetota bacterium]|nr:CPBP family intramembrane metalloprotease [Actinomycetota bacterium]